MTQVLLFAALRETAGSNRVITDKTNVGEILDELTSRHGETFGRLLPYCMLICDDKNVDRTSVISGTDELAILPPVSGG